MQDGAAHSSADSIYTYCNFCNYRVAKNLLVAWYMCLRSGVVCDYSWDLADSRRASKYKTYTELMTIVPLPLHADLHIDCSLWL